MPTPSFNRPDNLHSALQFNPTTGDPELRVTLGSETITITGSVNVGTVVEVSSTPSNPVHTHVSEVGTSGILAVPYMPSGIVDAAGHINDNTHPLYVDVVNGTLSVTQSGAWNVGITGTVAATQSGTWNVNVASIPEVEVKNDSGNPLSVSGTVTATQGTSPWVVSGNVNATIAGTPTVSLGGSQTDAFGRLRMSEPFTLFDSQSRYYDHQQFNQVTANGGTFNYDANSSTFRLGVTSAAGSSVISETYRVFPYQPGKSLLILATFCGETPKANVTQRVGFFGEQNGIYFEVAGTVLNMVIRSYSSGVLTEDRIPQSMWNGDKLNGTGASGITLFPDRDQIFWTDVEWLGVGSVRCGFVINGQYVTCHTFNHANVVGNVTTYMTTATLPIRYELFTTGVAAGASMLRQICSTVISEGGYNSFGITESAGTGITPFRLAALGTYYPIVSIRMAAGRLDSIIVPRQINILSPTVNYYRWVLLKNATLTGATWAGTSTTGSVQIDTAATGVVGGTELQSGYVSSRELTELGGINFFQFQLGRSLTGVSDTVSLVLTASSNNADVLAQLGWQELT